MGRFCYCSKILPGKVDTVREHWKMKRKQLESPVNEIDFWNQLKMTGFESWLQGDFIIHCLEGESLSGIFKGLQDQIAEGHPIATQLRQFYLNVLGKDYAQPAAEPSIQSLLNLSLPNSAPYIKRAFFYPLLPHKEADHLRFREAAMKEKRERHETMMRAFGVSHLSTWLQNSPHGKYIVVYTERHIHTPTSSEARLEQGAGSTAWAEIAAELCDHTGLNLEELSPDVEWLTG